MPKKIDNNISDESEIPEFYINSMQAALSPWDITLNLGVQNLGDIANETAEPIEAKATHKSTVRVRMSLQYAIVLTKVLEKALQDYQAKNGYIQLPHDVLTKLGIS